MKNFNVCKCNNEIRQVTINEIKNHFYSDGTGFLIIDFDSFQIIANKNNWIKKETALKKARDFSSQLLCEGCLSEETISRVKTLKEFYEQAIKEIKEDKEYE